MVSPIGRLSVLERLSYYADAQSWNADIVASLRRSRKRAWVVAAGASFVTVVAVGAVAMLVPLKTVVPYVIELERSTGYVQAARIADPATLSELEAVRQSNLYHYVLARETIDAADIASNYQKTLAWSAGEARAGYLRLWDEDEPDSLVGRYPVGTIISVDIKGISPLSPSAALVRFATRRLAPGGKAQAIEHWQAVVGYRYAARPLSSDQRFINPLGFQVTTYRRDPDVAVLPSDNEHASGVASGARP